MKNAAIFSLLLLAACASHAPVASEPTETYDPQPTTARAPGPVHLPAAPVPTPVPPAPQPDSAPLPESATQLDPGPSPNLDERPDTPETVHVAEPVDAEASSPVAATPDPLELLREAADEPDAPAPTKRMLIAALIARATPEALAEAEQRLNDLGNAPAAWVAAMRVAIAGLAGESAELASRSRRMYHDALAALPPEVGAVHVSDDFGGVDARHSISFRPDEYVSVAFELRHFGVRERDDGMWDWQVRASARLLDEDGVPVPGFAPPPFTYSPQKPGSNPASHPGDRWTWFVYLLEARLPRDLAAGNYTIELSVTDAMGKEHHGAVVRHVEIRVR